MYTGSALTRAAQRPPNADTATRYDARPHPARTGAPLGRVGSAQLEVRRVSAAGTFRLKATQPCLSNALRDQYIALEEIADGVWNIVYYRTLLGRIDERSGKITGV
jgi:hypothetical protein